ncbi:MAG: glycosyltransferase 61 family protein [Magnetococcus sp. YQC-5]
MSNFIETVMQLDARDDLPGLIAWLHSATHDPNEMLFAAYQLFINGRIRFAYVLARSFASFGYRNPVTAIIGFMGGHGYGTPEEMALCLEDLRFQLRSMEDEARVDLCRKVIVPTLWPQLHLAVNSMQPDHQQVLRILEIFSTALPQLRTQLDWNAPVPLLSLAQIRQQGREKSRLIHFSSPPVGAMRQKRRVLLVWPKILEPTLAPFDQSGLRILSAMEAYGWQAEKISLNPINRIDPYRAIPEVCRQKSTEVLMIAFDNNILMAIKDRFLDMMACLRRDRPDMKIMGWLWGASEVESAVLTEMADRLDVIWEESSPALPVWDLPALANKVLHNPGVHAGRHESLLHRPFSWPIRFARDLEKNDFSCAFWSSAANRLHLPLQFGGETEATCCLDVSRLGHPMGGMMTTQSYETLMRGALLLREASADMHYYFTAGEHFLEFSTLAELSAITRLLREQHQAIEEIRRCGQAFAYAHYRDEHWIGYLDKMLYFPDQAVPLVATRDPSLYGRHVELVSVEYVSVNNWCRPVPGSELLTGSGNLVAHVGTSTVQEPPIDVLGLRARGAGYEELFPTDAFFVGMNTPNFNYQTHRIVSKQSPFVARLEHVRIEAPGFGVLLDRHLLMAESYHNKKKTRDVLEWYPFNTKHSPRYRSQLEIPVERWDGRVSMTLDVEYYLDRGLDGVEEGPCILLSGAGFANYYHWMIEMLPRLWCLEAIPELRSLPLILYPPVRSYQVETLTALGIPQERIRLFTGRMIQVNTLIFPSYLVPEGHSVRNVIWLREHLLPALGVVTEPACHLLYISRSNASSRRIRNEEQVIHGLQTRGFQILHLEEMTVKAQVEAFYKARMVVMPHGASGANIVFAQPGAILIELLPSSNQHADLLIYASLSQCHYGCLLCEDESHNNSTDLNVDVEKLLKIVDKALSDMK